MNPKIVMAILSLMIQTRIDAYTDLKESCNCNETTLVCEIRCYTESVQDPLLVGYKEVI